MHVLSVPATQSLFDGKNWGGSEKVSESSSKGLSRGRVRGIEGEVERSERGTDVCSKL